MGQEASVHVLWKENGRVSVDDELSLSIKMYQLNIL
jgi:hypothetical protein